MSELSQSEVEQRTMAVIKEALRLPEDQKMIPEYQLGADLGGDSLGVIEMVSDLEEAFKIELSDDEKWETFTIADVLRLVNKGLEKK